MTYQQKTCFCLKRHSPSITAASHCCRQLFCHSNISTDSVGLKPNTHRQHLPSHKTHLATSELAAVLRICLSTSSLILSAQQHPSASTASVTEVHRYAEEKVISHNQDPLVWWRNHEEPKAGELISQRSNRFNGKNLNAFT